MPESRSFSKERFVEPSVNIAFTRPELRAVYRAIRLAQDYHGGAFTPEDRLLLAGIAMTMGFGEVEHVMHI